MLRSEVSRKRNTSTWIFHDFRDFRFMDGILYLITEKQTSQPQESQKIKARSNSYVRLSGKALSLVCISQNH